MSLVIEWENAARIGAARARRMLAEVDRQAGSLAPPFRVCEAVFTYAGGLAVEREVEESVRLAGFELPWRAIESPDPSYVGQKRHGARHSRGSIVVVLDSDVIPEPGWLKGLLAPFADRATEVVCGGTFIAPRGLYSSAMALGWLFPLRRREEGLVEVSWMQANNFAVRRDVFLALPAPPCEGHRDGTMRMVDDLVGRGHRIWHNRAALVDHPPPDSLRHFAERALWSGFDKALRSRRKGARLAGAGRMLLDLVGSWGRVRRGHREVGLGPAGALAAVGILTVYYAIRLAGFAGALIAPDRLRRVLSPAQPTIRRP